MGKRRIILFKWRIIIARGRKLKNMSTFCRNGAAETEMLWTCIGCQAFPSLTSPQFLVIGDTLSSKLTHLLFLGFVIFYHWRNTTRISLGLSLMSRSFPLNEKWTDPFQKLYALDFICVKHWVHDLTKFG